MKTTPDAPCRLGRTLYDPSFEWLDLGTRRVKEELYFFLDPIDLERVESDDLVLVIS